MARFIISGFADEIAPDLDAQLSGLAELGIRHIEMRNVDGRPIVRHTAEEVKAIGAKLRAKGIRLSAVGSPIGKVPIGDDLEEHYRLFEHTVSIAKELGARFIRVFSYYLPKGGDPADHRDAVLASLSRMAAEAGRNGLCLVHENEHGIYGDSPERNLDIIESVGSPHLRMNFDPANFIMDGYEPYPHAYGLLKPYIAYVHIKDGTFEGKKIVPCGYGDGRIGETLADLAASGYDGFLSIEPHLGSFQGFALLSPGSKINDMPESDLKKFRMAHESLMKALSGIGATIG